MPGHTLPSGKCSPAMLLTFNPRGNTLTPKIVHLHKAEAAWKIL